MVVYHIYLFNTCMYINSSNRYTHTTELNIDSGDLYTINSLAPGIFEWNFKYVIFTWILVIDGWGICCEIVLKWMSLDFTDDQSTLVQVMAWCHQATSYYLSQCWPRFLLPYGVTRPQWVKCPVTCIKLTHYGLYGVTNLDHPWFK